ncbi:related to Golgi apparatus membrane protein TVP38 [Phialocephala subalpina]|uniref:Golgi apparatus membrane protein TVP38 n=1 Tax=Phialocephala subalpina TaxID=576137 RepID=A0A1L7X6L5_9HELO|nr:related to Golgi apparatus membrane protein TVP38 [Phialocephala subalpina]
MVMRYQHQKRGSDDDTVALTTIDTIERQSSNSEPDYEYTQVKWKDYVTKKKYIPWWILAIIGGVLVGLMTLYHDQIVDALRPVSTKIRDLPAGFLIPVAILIAISFPPLFGHEIIALLCGVVYGLWIGFAIVAAGTFFGEVGTWFAFKYAFRKKAEKLEKTNLNYGALARVTRDGGFWIVLVIRFSIIPSHFSTAVFSTCDVNFWFFAIATFLTLPKQIILVYVGVLLTQQSTNNTLNYIVAGTAFIITVFAGYYIYSKMQKVKKVLLEEQEARKQAKREAPRPPSMAPMDI